VPTHQRDESHQEQIEQTDWQQIFPFQIQQLINTEPRECPAKPHDHEDEKESFSHKPN
jgi:hypothetical protein